MHAFGKLLFTWVVSLSLVFGLTPLAYADPSYENDAEQEIDGVLSDRSVEDEGNTPNDGEVSSLGESEKDPQVDSGQPDSDDVTEKTDGKDQDASMESPESEDPQEGSEGDDANAVEDASSGEPTTYANNEENQIALLALPAEVSNVIPDGDYAIASALNPRQVLDVSGGSKSNGGNVQLYASNVTPAQKWHVSHDEDGYVVFSNKGSGKVLDVSGAKTGNKTNVQQYEPNGTPAQKWVVAKEGNGYKITSALKEDMVLDVNGGSSANGANVQLYQSNNTKAQRFSFISLTPHVAASGQLNLGDGYYEIESKLNGSYVCDVSAASLANGANVQLYSRNGTPAQYFKFVKVGDYYRIETSSGKAVDVAAANIVNGTNVQQYGSNGTDAQLWSIRNNGDGSYTFISKANGLALDVSDGKARNSQNIQCYEENNTPAQKFVLKKRDRLVNDGIYEVLSALGTSKVIDVSGASRSNGANVQLYQANGTQAQKWLVRGIQGKNSSYTLQCVGSGKYLAMDANGNVCQRNAASDGSQYWEASISGGRIALINERYGKALDVKGAGTANETNMQGYSPNGTNAQKFSFSGVAVLNNGMYAIRSAQNPNQVLDVKSGSRSDGANVQSYSWNNTGAQKWNVYANSDGTFTIVNAQSGKALDVKDGRASAGANVQQYRRNSTNAQKWVLVNNEDGTFKWASALNRQLFLTISGNPANGANVCLGSNGQSFYFEGTTYKPAPTAPTEQQMMRNRINGYSSGTQWLIAVNRSNHKVGVFRGSANKWTLQYYWSCVTGTSRTPTLSGSYRTTGYKKLTLSTDRRAKWCTQIYGGYFFHSILASESELNKSLSHGCIRLAYSNAQWIYNNIGRNTAVILYN